MACLLGTSTLGLACASSPGSTTNDGAPVNGDGDAARADGDAAPADGGGDPDAAPPSAAMQLACGALLDDSLRFLRVVVDRDTGLPYDQLPCGGPHATTANGFDRAFGVVPQLAYAQIGAFTEDPATPTDLVWSFDDSPLAAEAPDLFYALKVTLQLHDGSAGAAADRFGGITWGANASLRRYATVRIRYRTGAPAETWQLKLNAGSPPAEVAVDLPGSPSDVWVERTFSLRDDFPGLDLTQLNYLVVATSNDLSGGSPTIWIDRIAFQLDPAQADVCAVSCAGGAYPDLSCYEPQTGVVNIANALTAFAVAPAAGRLGMDDARGAVGKILGALEAMPVHGGFMADWHSPVSGSPDPRNAVASLTDQPQLYAALMVVEASLPELAARAAALRDRFDLRSLYEGADCPGTLHWATDTCHGPLPGGLELLGNDSLLGEFLAVASGAAPTCLWRDGLARRGCSLDGPADAPWYTTGRFCMDPTLPGTDTGGPFLQLAPLLYLDSDRVPMGALSLGDSAAHMLQAQATYAASAGLPLFGWSNSSDPDRCEYLGCGALCPDEPGTSRLCPAKVTPYVSAMGLDRLGETAAANLAAFAAAGAGAPFDTGTRSYRFGLRDAWNLQTGTGRDAFLYLDTGWTALGLLNACSGELVRKRFSEHAVARAGYAALATQGPACAPRGCDSIADLRVAGQLPGGEISADGPVKVDWSPSSCPAVVQAYHGGALVFPPGAPSTPSVSGVALALPPDAEPYEIKVWVPGAASPSASAWVRVAERLTALDEQPGRWATCQEDPAVPCDGAHPSCCAEPAAACTVTAAPQASDAVCSALRLSRAGAGNCHFYVNLPPASAHAFRMALRFRVDDRGTCNDQGAPATIQAVEFSMSDWTGTVRHEWALQWENVADVMSAPAPAWRLWQPGRWSAIAGDVATGTGACLAQGEWHRLRLEGTVVADQAQYTRATIDCQDVDVAGAPAATVPDAGAARLSVAVQLDVASASPSYAVLIDDVELRYEP